MNVSRMALSLAPSTDHLTACFRQIEAGFQATVSKLQISDARLILSPVFVVHWRLLSFDVLN